MSAAAKLVLATACAAALVLALCAQSAGAQSQWETVTQLPGGARSHATVVAMNNGYGLLLMGGYAQLDGTAPPTDLLRVTGTAGVNFEVFGDAYVTRDGTAWKSTPPVGPAVYNPYGPTSSAAWSARANSAAVIGDYSGSIYLYGGLGRNGVILSDLWVSSNSATTWSPVTVGVYSPGPRVAHAMTYSMASPTSSYPTRYIFVIGGRQNAYDTTGAAQVWRSIGGTSWTYAHDATYTFGPRWGHSAVSIGGVPLIAGGYDGTGAPRNDVWRATDYSGENWQLLTSAAEWTPRAYFGLPLFNSISQNSNHAVTGTSTLAFAVGGTGAGSVAQGESAYDTDLGLTSAAGWQSSTLINYANSTNSNAAGVVAAAVVYECGSLWSIGGLQGDTTGARLNTTAAVRRLDMRSLSSLSIPALSTLPSRCAPGTYGCNAYCYSCSSGTYAANSGAFSCDSCPAGSYSSYGASSCTLCPAGQYTPYGTSGACSYCSYNTYSAVAGATACTACATGTYTVSSGATACYGGSDENLSGWNVMANTIGGAPLSSSSYTGRAYAAAVALPNNQGLLLVGGWRSLSGNTPSPLSGYNLVMTSTEGTFLSDAWRSTDGGQSWAVSYPWSGYDGRYMDGRAAHAMAAVVNPTDTTTAGTVFLYGGVGYNGLLSDTWTLSSNPQIWRRITGCTGSYYCNSPGARAGHALVARATAVSPGYYTTHLFLLGGATSYTVASADVWFSSDSANTWTLMTSTAAWGARAGHSAMVINGVAFLMGGYSSFRELPNGDVWKSSDSYLTQWTLVSSATAWSPKRAFHGAVNAQLRTRAGLYSADVTVVAGGGIGSTGLTLSGLASVSVKRPFGNASVDPAVASVWTDASGLASYTSMSVTAQSVATGLVGAPLVYQCGYVYSLTGMYVSGSVYYQSYTMTSAVRRVRINDLLNNTLAPGSVNATSWPCGSGTYGCDGACSTCYPGKYSATAGAPTCALCPAGKYGNSYGLTQCTTCNYNTYSATNGQTSCYACPTGSYSSTGASSCSTSSTGGGSSSGMKGGAIAGAVIGSIFGVTLIAGLVAYCCIKRRAAVRSGAVGGGQAVEGAPYHNLNTNNSLGMVVLPPAPGGPNMQPSQGQPQVQMQPQYVQPHVYMQPQQQMQPQYAQPYGQQQVVVVPHAAPVMALEPAPMGPAQAPESYNPQHRNAPPPPAYTSAFIDPNANGAGAGAAKVEPQYAYPALAVAAPAPHYDAAAHQGAASRVVVVNGGGMFAPLNAQAP